jgi:hypothetical protein
MVVVRGRTRGMFRCCECEIIVELSAGIADDIIIRQLPLKVLSAGSCQRSITLQEEWK